MGRLACCRCCKNRRPRPRRIKLARLLPPFRQESGLLPCYRCCVSRFPHWVRPPRTTQSEIGKVGALHYYDGTSPIFTDVGDVTEKASASSTPQPILVRVDTHCGCHFAAERTGLTALSCNSVPACTICVSSLGWCLPYRTAAKAMICGKCRNPLIRRRFDSQQERFLERMESECNGTQISSPPSSSDDLHKRTACQHACKRNRHQLLSSTEFGNE